MVALAPAHCRAREGSCIREVNVDVKNESAWNAAVNTFNGDCATQGQMFLSYEGRNNKVPLQCKGWLTHRGERLDTILEKNN
jgi:hypothetical protein